MNNLHLRNSLLATLVCFAAYAPTSSAIVKHQSVRHAFEAGVSTVTVNFSDLDIARGAGIEILYQRLRTAAKAVCGTHDGRDLSRSQQWRQCYRQALDGAVKQVGNERLEELHRG